MLMCRDFNFSTSIFIKPHRVLERQGLNYEESWDKETVVWEINTTYDDDDRRFKLEDTS